MRVAEEMVVRLRATAEGVKQGVAAARGSLQELQKEQEKLKTELQLKINSEEIKKLKTEMSELEKQKKELEQTVRFKVESDSTVRLRMELQEIEEQMGLLQESIDLHMTLKDDTNARGELDWLASEKERLEGEIKLSISTYNEDTKKKLLETEKQIADIDRNIQIKIDESGANELSSKLKAVDEDIKNVKASSAEMEKSFNQVSIAAGAAFAAILVGAKKGLDSFNQYTATMNGLSSQMEYLGINIVDAMDAVQRKSADGLISPADAAASIKNLTSYGYTLQMAEKYTEALADTAVYNKQAHYSVSEAVRVTTEGIKNENSVLSDAAGMTKNISVMYKEYANSIGKTVNELTQAEKVQATYNIGMAEMAAYTGNAAEYLNTLGGAQDTLEASASNLAIAYGEALAPAVQTVTEATTGLINNVTEFVRGQQSLTAGVTATGLAITGYIVILKTLKFALGEAATAASLLDVALKGITKHPIIAALTVGIGVITGIVTAIKNAKQEAEEYAEKMQALNEKVEEYITLSKQGITDVNAEAFKNMNEELSKNYDVFSQVVDAYKTELDALEDAGTAKEFWWINTENFAVDKLNELGADVEGLTAIFGAFGIQIDVASATYEELVAAGEKVRAKLQEQNAQIAEYDRKQKNLSSAMEATRKSFSDYTNELNKLASAYETLSKKEDLSVSQLTELIQLYPSVAKEIAENGVQRERLAEIINTEMKASREAAIQELADKKAVLETERDRIKAFIKGYQDEANAHNTALAEEKQGLADFVNAALKAKEDIENNRLSTVSVEKVATTGMQTLIDLVAQYDKDIGNLEDRMNALRNTPLYDSSKATKKEKETTTELEKQLQLLEDQKATKEMSVEEEVDRLKEISHLYAKTDAEKLEVDKRLYAKRKDLADKHYADEIKEIEKLNKGRTDNTDFAGMIKKYKAFGEEIKSIYADYPETMKEKLEEVNDIIIDLVQKRADKVAGIEQKNLEKIIGLYEEHIDTMKKLDGLSYGFDEKGDPKTFTYGAAEEKADVEKILQAVESTLADIGSAYQNAKQEYQDILQEVEGLGIDLSQTMYGNIDTNSRQILEWTENNLETYKSALESWGSTVEEMRGSFSTVFGGSENFDGIEIAFSPMLQTDKGAVLLSRDTVYNYIDTLMSSLGESWTSEDLIRLDTQGIEIDGQIIKNLIADIGETAIKTGEAMHFTGDTGAVAEAKDALTKTAAEYEASYDYLIGRKEYYIDKMKDLTIKEIEDRQKLYEKENEDRLKAMEKLEAEILALQKEKIKEAISAEKERTKGLIDEVKKRYDAEIKAAEDAANAEIAVYEDKIKAIDALLKAEERQEADEDYQDKINRLKETLKFETDDSNKYELQKEIANLTAENEKRKRKESLEDEKESYREKIDLAKNNLSQQKEALQEKRDAEIAMHEEALESYTKKLEEELSALEKNNKKSIDDLKQTLATQKREYAAFLKQKKDDTATNNTEIEKLMNQSTTNILDKLKERVSEFADAGASAGAAWRNAFNEMVADIMSSTDSYSANVASAQAATMMQSPSTTNNSVQLQQIINTPTASPAKVARESKKALENAVRYL